MGTRIDRETFDEADYARFRQRLEHDLSTLGGLLGRPGFGVGPSTLGAELELFLIDGAGRPLPVNQAVCSAAADPRINLELDRFNLELNASPTPLAGRPFAAMGDELHSLLELASDDVAPEGANTSFQVHLRVDPADFTRTYNAVQLATAPVLAAVGNSPTFLGHRLWEETRVALCKQTIDDRDGRGPRRRAARVALGSGWLRGGPLELFAEGVRLHQPVLPVLGDHAPPDGGDLGHHAPGLDALRLHQGTVWRWNRAIYDPAAGGHLRIEMRALPAGPTVTDMLANAAFLVGLSRWLAEQDDRWTRTLSFERAEADGLLAVIAGRVATGQTGAAWQRRTLAALEPRLGRRQALAAMLERYLECAATGQPVHTWPAHR